MAALPGESDDKIRKHKRRTLCWLANLTVWWKNSMLQGKPLQSPLWNHKRHGLGPWINSYLLFRMEITTTFRISTPTTKKLKSWMNLRERITKQDFCVQLNIRISKTPTMSLMTFLRSRFGARTHERCRVWDLSSSRHTQELVPTINRTHTRSYSALIRNTEQTQHWLSAELVSNLAPIRSTFHVSMFL